MKWGPDEYTYLYHEVGGRLALDFDFEMQPRKRGKKADIEAIMAFVSTHPHSYASLAVCRRALDSGIHEIDGNTLQELHDYLNSAPDDEVEAYYSIIS